MGEFESFIGVNFWTGLFTLLNFLAVLIVGKRFLWGPVMKMITERQQEIDGMYAQANAAKAQAEDMRAEYTEKLDEASDKAERLVKEAVARGQARQEEILRQANQEADNIRAKAHADIAQEKKKALNEAKDEISVIALAVAGKVVGRTLDENDQAALVDRFIDELGDEV